MKELTEEEKYTLEIKEQQEEDERKKAEINIILDKILTKDEKTKYIKLSEAIGYVYGLMFMLEKTDTLKSLEEDTQSKLKNSVGFIVTMAGENLEKIIGKEKSEKIRKELIERDLA